MSLLSSDTSGKQGADQVRIRIEDWRRRLIDLSFRNRLINYKPTQSTTLQVEHPGIHDLFPEPGTYRSFDFYFPPEPDEDEGEDEDEEREDPKPQPGELVTQVTSRKRLERMLDTLARRSNGEFADKGIRILHLAIGFLRWTDPQRREAVRSPLILIPAELRRESARHPYRLYFPDDEETVINPALTIKLQEMGVEVPEDWDWENKSIREELADIRRAVGETDWEVEDRAVLSLFTFQKLVMYRDLLENEDRIARHKMVRALASGTINDRAYQTFAEVPSEAQLDDVQAPEESFSILDADASQRRCIEAAKRGCSFVMHGPPGTGKSQTIANIIAEALGDGKSVLFISEKMAALEVVHERLKRRGIAEFCLQLHGRDASRKAAVEELYKSLSKKTQPRKIPSESEFNRLRASRSRLTEAVRNLHTRSPMLGDRSARDVYARLAVLSDAPVVPGAPPATESVGPDVEQELSAIREQFRVVSDHWTLAMDSEFPWHGFSGRKFGPELQRELTKNLEALQVEAADLERSARGVADRLGVKPSASLEEAQRLADLDAHLSRAPKPIPETWLEPAKAAAAAEALEAARTAFAELRTAEDELRARYPVRNAAAFSPNMTDRLSSALRKLEEVIGRSPEWETSLLPKLGPLQEAADRGPAAIDEALEVGAQLAKHMGQPWTDPTLSDVEKLIALTELAFTANQRPDKRWLVPAGLSAAATAAEEIEAAATPYRKKLAELRKTYRDAVLNLDLTPLRLRIEEAQGKLLGKLRSRYRADIAALRELRIDGTTPEDPSADVQLAMEVLGLRDTLDEVLNRHTTALGAWNRGRDVDFEALQQALDVARKALELVSDLTDLDALAAQLCVGTEVSPTTAQLAGTLTRILDDLRGWSRLISSVAASSSVPLEDRSLAGIRDLFSRLRDPVSNLGLEHAELSVGRGAADETLSALENDALVIDHFARCRQLVEAESARWSELLAERYQGSDTDWASAAEALRWASVLGELGPTSPPARLRDLVVASGGHVPSRDLESACHQVAERCAIVGSWFDGDVLLTQLERDDLSSVVALAKRMAATLDSLPGLTDFNDAVAQLREAGWTEFLQRLASEEILPMDIPRTAEAAYWRARLQLYFAANPHLEEFRGRSHERLIEEFKELDRRLIHAATDRIIAACNARRPSPVALRGSEVGLLTHEAKKRRRHLPVRKLFARLPTILPRLKPCLMMSPLAVSHYLSPDHHFDLVIFDEASQVPPWDAINCIYRGEQIVVAGDSKQLPPTSFFQLADPDADEDEDDGDSDAPREELMESILDACATVLPEESLRWHYRSRHEHLIAFSNHRFYGNSLVTFPAPALESPDLGVRFIHVPDGIYDRGASRTNRVEARRVAQRVCELLEEDPSRSVGVTTFNFAQTEAILDELDRLLAERPDLEQHFDHDGEREEVFVKNLESVQGDERDVILFSIGYGRDQHGKFYMGFGPLNKEGGHRRLNVAVTRARERVEVFSSVRARDFQLGEKASVGARALQAYLDFAERGPSALAEEIESLGGEYESPFEEAVAAAVRDLGYQVVPQVGVGGFRIDLGVVDPAAPGRFVLGIECDGATYHSTPTARDRDRLRQSVLESLGWRIHRIWSWDWVRERPTEINRLKTAIERAVEARDHSGASNSDQDTTTRQDEVAVVRHAVDVAVHEIKGPEEALNLPWVEPYEVATLSGFETHLAFHEPDNRSRLHKALKALVRVEAPIHHDYAIKRLAEAQGIKRRGSRITGTGRNIIQAAVRKGRIELRGDFIWRPGQELAKVRVPHPTDPATRRRIDDIPPEEIALAFKHLIVASVPDDLDALVQQVARLFGFDRTGASIQEVLMTQLRALIDDAASAS